jgi:dipeptidyl aminopeptidase/acylaminoacyl peptidase
MYAAKSTGWSSLALVLVLLAPLAEAKAAEPPPVEAYAALPFRSGGERLSPDGKSLALVAPAKGHYALVVWPLEPGRKPEVIPTAPWLPDVVWWKTNQRLVVRVEFYAPGDGFQPVYAARAIAIDATGANPIYLISQETGNPARPPRVQYLTQDQGKLVAPLPDDPEHILLQVDDPTHPFPDVRRVNINDGGATLPIRGREGVENWRADPNGIVRLAIGRIRTDQTVLEVQVRDDADSSWRIINRRDTSAGDPVFVPLAFSATDPKILYVLRPSKYGNLGLYTFDTVQKTVVDEVAASPRGQILTQVIDNRLVSYSDPENLGRLIYLDPAWSKDFAVVERALPGAESYIVDRLPDGSRVLIYSHRNNEPGSYWLLDRTTGKTALTEVAPDYDRIAPEQVAPVKVVSYQARDGQTIPALLTLPLKPADGPIPFVVLPHDGPAANDSAGNFDYVAQFLASRGYGVLQPQFRGSTGNGLKFLQAGNGNWGTTVQNDITDGTKWLIDQKLAVPGRIAILGSGFGGFAALNGAVREPGLYKAAIALDGFFDLVDLHDRYRRFANKDELLASLGYNISTDVLAANSPARHADKIAVPLLLIHGRKDYHIPAAQTETLEAALKAAGKPAEVLYLPEGDHGLTSSDDRLTYLKAVERFLAANL